ncbi:tyrosine-type recombinase/integrase [Nocardia sp. CA-084685]|uniref:tyrosine-type recombinase/integrase n=1 Tax=Nocardia sp. CA-084685 TaxID=3239970 RepID=UPI003D991D53
METACRRNGALHLRPCDLDPHHCLIRLREKEGIDRWQPVSPTLMRHLLHHAEQRHSPPDGQLLRYRNGKPITARRYDHLWTRIGEHLPWVATQHITSHWLRHTTLTWVEHTFGYATARTYAGHHTRKPTAPPPPTSKPTSTKSPPHSQHSPKNPTHYSPPNPNPTTHDNHGAGRPQHATGTTMDHIPINDSAHATTHLKQTTHRNRTNRHNATTVPHSATSTEVPKTITTQQNTDIAPQSVNLCHAPANPNSLHLNTNQRHR